jgi:hypothetical protein
MQVEGFIGTGVGVNVGWPSLGDISFAESPDDLFGPRGYLVTKASLRDCGYVLVSADEDTEAYSGLDEVDGKLSAPAEAIEKATAAWWEAIKGCEGQSIEPAIRATVAAALPLLRYEVQ